MYKDGSENKEDNDKILGIIKQNVDLYLTNHMLFRILSYLELPVPRFFKTDPPIS